MSSHEDRQSVYLNKAMVPVVEDGNYIALLKCKTVLL